MAKPVTVDLSALLAASTPEDRATRCAELVATLATSDLVALRATTLKSLKDTLADKGRPNEHGRASALGALRAIHAKFGRASEAVLVPFVPDAFAALADKRRPVSFEAERLLEALFEALSPHAVKLVLPMILDESGGKWQTNLGRANALARLSSSCDEQIHRALTSVVPNPKALKP